MEQTLLLNATYEPLKVVHWQKAITLLWQGKVEVLEVYDRDIKGVSLTIKLPAVMRLLRPLLTAVSIESGLPTFSDVPWLSVSPTEATIEPDGSIDIDVTVDSTGPSVTLSDPGAVLSGTVALGATTGGGAVRVEFSVSPANARRPPSRRTSASTWRGRAPSAMRTPNSCRRSATP